MTKRQALQLFQEKKVRTVWDDQTEEWYFSIVDVIGVLTDSENPRKYWSVLKTRLNKEGNQTATICSQLRMKADDGKMRLTDVATMKGVFRIIQSVPSPKAEPFKVWMAQVAAKRIEQLQDPELSIEQAVADYRRLGYSEAWINQRIRSIEVRKELTDEWQKGGVEGQQYASLTDIITKTWSGMTTRQYKDHKGLHKENLRDNMTNIELALNTLAEASTTELARQQQPQGFQQNAKVAREGGSVAQAARSQLESKLGRSVISKRSAAESLSRNPDNKNLPE